MGLGRKDRIVVWGGRSEGTHYFRRHHDARSFWDDLSSRDGMRYAEWRRWGRAPDIPGKFWTWHGDYYGKGFENVATRRDYEEALHAVLHFV